MRHFLWAVGLTLWLAQPAWTQPYHGEVYGVYPEGVMIVQGSNSFLLPSQHATFEVGGVRASLSNLVPGQTIQAIIPQQYLPQVQPIPDPYAWKVKHHPNHPHGGPPGQMKKNAPPGPNPGRSGQGQGKGKGR